MIYKIIFIFGFLMFKSIAVGQRHELIQKSLETEKLIDHISRNNSIINSDSVTIINTTLIELDSLDFNFLNKKTTRYISSKIEIDEVSNWNLNITKVDQLSNKATVVFEYYPIWKSCETSPYPSYTNALFFVVENSFELINDEWVRTYSDIQDIAFLNWMKMISWKCIYQKYQPL